MKKKYYCKKCEKEITNSGKSGLCRRCVHTGIHNHENKNNPNFKKGGTFKMHYCIESNCNNKICYDNWRKGKGRCKPCSMKGKRNPYFGKHHTQQSKQKISKANKGKLTGKSNPMFGKPTPHKKRIYYKGICMRSSYEMAFAKWLDLSNYNWQYESKTFNLGNTTYTPDFYLPESDCYIEIKGWWWKKAIIKFKLFKKLYPNINIKVLMKKELQELGVLN